MLIRLAQLYDLEEILEITAEIVRHLKEQNIPQWQNNYPNTTILTDDIMHQTLYVAVINDSIVGFFNLSLEKDPSYDVIYQGKWLTKDKPYAVIHRMAVKIAYHKQGVAKAILMFAKDFVRVNGYASIRIDTHELNIAMNRLLLHMGYVYCGIIHLIGYSDEDKMRNAYELLI